MTGKSIFRFQQFAVDDRNCGMKIGTDGVLLGAWTGIDGCRRILDIGTGSGLVALMVAQRTQTELAEVVGLEIDRLAAEQAAENFQRSPWADRLNAVHRSLQAFTRETREAEFCTCVCNPPFFEQSLLSKRAEQRVARHSVELSRADLFRCTKSLLRMDGRLSLVLPFDQLESTVYQARDSGLNVSRITRVRPMPDRAFKRVLIEFRNGPGESVVEEDLVVETTRHEFSPQYEALTRDFHLRFQR